MSIAADFVIDTDTRILKHVAGTTVYTVNDLYSYVQDYFDEITALAVTIPMSAQTPTEYSLINGWFIPEESYKYLRAGAVKTLGWDITSFADGVMIATLSTVGYVACDPTDIGRVITDGTRTGILLDYDNTLRKWWIRKTSILAVSGSVAITGGTGAGSISALVSGENTYANIYTLGSLDPATTNTVYVEQVNSELPNNQIVQYWPSGHVDLLVKVREAGTLINSGNIRVFVREYTNLYSHFSIDASSGGRNPVPLGTSDDSNNQTSSATVAGWNDVTVTFGPITRNLSNGAGLRPYDVEIDCGSRTSLAQVYERLKLITARASGYTLNGYPGQFYRSANVAYDDIVTAPFGTYAGGQFFGARGVYLKNVPATDLTSYRLIDSNNVSQSPPYITGIALSFNPTLAADGANTSYSLFFKQINVLGVSSPFGTGKAVIVKRADGVTPIQGDLTGNVELVTVDFDFDGNTQAVWTASTNYTAGDFYRRGSTWYVVTAGYTSGLTFGATDTTNSTATAGPDVVLVAIGRSSAQYVQTENTINRVTTNSIVATGPAEFNYSNAPV